MTLRPDQHYVTTLISTGTRVLDIGCGEGEFLAHLKAERNIQPYGIELDSHKAAKAVSAGLSVIQGDVDEDLSAYPAYEAGKSGFDIALLCNTLQVFKRPDKVLKQALTIAERVIVVSPNFGHIYNRLYLLLKGEMPVSRFLRYQWYETPNIHFSTIKDMVKLAESLSCTIEHRAILSQNGSGRSFSGSGGGFANLFGKESVLVLRNHHAQ